GVCIKCGTVHTCKQLNSIECKAQERQGNQGTASRTRARAIAPRTAGHRRAGGPQARRPGDAGAARARRALQERQRKVSAGQPVPHTPSLCSPASAPCAQADRAGSEVKFDGWRAQLHKRGREVAIYTKRGHDYTSRLPVIARGLAALTPYSLIIDGEL